jgi:hypothetical protein
MKVTKMSFNKKITSDKIWGINAANLTFKNVRIKPIVFTCCFVRVQTLVFQLKKRTSFTSV